MFGACLVYMKTFLSHRRPACLRATRLSQSRIPTVRVRACGSVRGSRGHEKLYRWKAKSANVARSRGVSPATYEELMRATEDENKELAEYVRSNLTVVIGYGRGLPSELCGLGIS